MRLSAGAIKGNHQRKQSLPKEGSKLREYYDLLVQGKAISFKHISNNLRSSVINQLRDYDLEIITIRDSSTTGRGAPSVLHKCIGIWVGDTLQSIEDVEVALDNTVQPKQ